MGSISPPGQQFQKQICIVVMVVVVVDTCRMCCTACM
jgi:hypothetical protein